MFRQSLHPRFTDRRSLGCRKREESHLRPAGKQHTRFWGDTLRSWVALGREWGTGWGAVLQGLERRGKVLRPPSSADLVFCREQGGLKNLVSKKSFLTWERKYVGIQTSLVSGVQMPEASQSLVRWQVAMRQALLQPPAGVVRSSG